MSEGAMGCRRRRSVVHLPSLWREAGRSARSEGARVCFHPPPGVWPANMMFKRVRKAGVALGDVIAELYKPRKAVTLCQARQFRMRA